jgi:hypothetical protein
VPCEVEVARLRRGADAEDAVVDGDRVTDGCDQYLARAARRGAERRGTAR